MWPREAVALFSDYPAAGGQGVFSARAVRLLDAHGAVVGRWDRVRLEQILTNLLSNAVKYGEGSEISITVRTDGETAVLEVADGGLGVPKEDHERIFERFERGPHGSAPGGFGVGLWIVREIALALRGSVRIESAPGRGATFTVVLPIKSAAMAAADGYV